jgi:serine/threonine-protein kinase RsbW
MIYERFIKLTIESKIDSIDLLSVAVRAICKTVIHDPILLYNVVLCLVEATTNVIKHAYHRKPGNLIEVLITIDDFHLVFQVIDSGEKTSIPPPKKELYSNAKDITSLPESGMGLFLIGQIMDQVSFDQQEGKNVLTMIKNIK